MNACASPGLVGLVSGGLCACGARNTHRNPWPGFPFGWLRAPVAAPVLAWRNANDRPTPRNLDDRGRADLLATRKDVP